MILLTTLAAATISVSSALPEMYDLNRLPWPVGARVAQSSSYDRASTSSADAKTWFANGDYGKFIRTETNDGRTENVMADLKGPGMVTRVWSANPSGTIRFYFDGETTPRLQASMNDLLHGRVAPFSSPFGYEAARGCNLFFPLPYAQSLKITAEGDLRGLYYHVDHRTYRPGTSVETFSMEAIPNLDEVKKKILTPAKPEGRQELRSVTVMPGKRTTLFMAVGPAQLNELRVRLVRPEPVKSSWLNASAMRNRLRRLVLRAKCDGESVIYAPLGDFFTTAAGLTPHQSMPFGVEDDGTMVCRFPMPTSRRLEFTIENQGREAEDLAVEAYVQPLSEVPPLRFHAEWRYVRQRTRPMKDLTLMNATGAGRFVGVFLHLENPVPGWWGEGDEKIYVDGETFPSTFGTGTEDYFGYAWSNPALFSMPYHGQSRCDGPGTFGHSNIYRWQIFDSISFNSSLKFDLEMWHWNDVVGSWATTAYWYSALGGSKVKESPVRLPTELKLASRKVKGAIEGESLKVVSSTGGTYEKQGGFSELSGEQQLWWLDPKEGDKLTLELPVPEDGRYQVVMNLCHARDYGIHEIYVNGMSLKRTDFYSSGLGWSQLNCGTLQLSKGTAVLEIVCRGNNASAEPRRMFGLDYVKLVRK